MSPARASFYVTGGTLRGDAACYVPRQADRDLYQGLKRGDFCYVLTSRQMGKSSLMVRTAQRLRHEGVDVAVLDLTAIGQNLTGEQWYDGLLGHLGQQLQVEDEVEQFWQEHLRLAPLQRWMRALREVVLPRCRQQLVIFVDEIDAVHSLPFSADEFFAAIRECYNRRSEDPELARLTFCLLGVATPSDLIRDTRTTPFNIGHRVELRDFTAAEAAPLAQGLGQDEHRSARLLQRILYWTGGHPYLTQRLCQTVSQDASVAGPAGVDRVCEGLFLSHRARERDDNLLFVRERVLRSDVDRAALMDLYDQVRRRHRVRDDETNPLVSVLRLSGVARVFEGYLWVRNRIYYRVFDREWVLANMPDAEKRRQRRAYRRGLLRASIVAAALFVMVAAVWAWWWDTHYRVKTEYYANLVKRWGVPEGVGRLTEEQAHHRSTTLRFYRRGGLVEKVEVINGVGELTGHHDLYNTEMIALSRASQETDASKACQWEYIRDADQNVIFERASDHAHRPVYGLLYAPTPNTREVIGHYVDKNGFLKPRAASGAASVKFLRSADGFEQKVRFFNPTGTPRPDDRGTFGEVREMNAQGLVGLATYLGSGDGAAVSTDGYAQFSIAYDEFGNRTEMICLGVDGQPVLHNDGFTMVRATYDRWGNLKEQLYLNTNGQPVNVADGYAKRTSKYDDHGNLTEEAYFDAEGKPTRHRNGYVTTSYQHDQHGNIVETTFFDLGGKLIKCAAGYAKATARYDDSGNQIEEAYFDETNTPIVVSDGYARYTAKYDERGNVIAQAYFDRANAPALLPGGYASYTAQYDERGNQTEKAYFDRAGKPTKTDQGYASIKAQYDDRGNEIEEAYFDEANKPILLPDGYARYTAQFDDRGNEIERAYFDAADHPTRHTEGYTKWTRSYNERGKLVEATYSGYDAAKWRYSQRRMKYDELGRIIEVANFDSTGKATPDEDGHARWTTKYDNDNHEVEQNFFDTDGKPAPYADGYTGWRKKYQHGKLVEQIYVGYAASNGFAKEVVKYNAEEQEVEGAYLDAADQPARNKLGYTKWTKRYDESGGPVEATYWGFDGQNGFSKIIVKLDDRGLGIEFNLLDAANHPARHKDGYTKWTMRYDESGTEVETTYWGYDGRNGFAKMVVKPNDKGWPVEYTYFNSADQPTRHANGFFRKTRRYDEQGNPIEDTFSGYDGSLGFVKMIVKLDQKGNEVEYAYFDAADEPTRYISSYSKETRQYDQAGKPVENIYWGFDAERYGFSKEIAKVDDKGRETEYYYLDSTGQLTTSKGGFARAIRIYDDRGAPIDARYFDFRPVDVKPLVMYVIPDSQAARLGLQEGDIFLRYNGEETSNSLQLIAQRRNEKPSDPPRELVIRRGEQVLRFNVSPGLLGASLNDQVVPETKAPAADSKTAGSQ